MNEETERQMERGRGPGRGRRGDPEGHSVAGRLGGNATVSKYGSSHMAALGRIGGSKNSVERMREIGKLGGAARAKQRKEAIDPLLRMAREGEKPDNEAIS